MELVLLWKKIRDFNSKQLKNDLVMSIILVFKNRHDCLTA